MLKILGGEYRSRQLRTPPDSDVTRPYAGRAKESVFNLLRGWFEDVVVLDLFAGVGSIGLEAVSRGARTAIMVEMDKKIFTMLEANIELLDCGDRVRAVRGDATSLACLAGVEPPVDLIFVDPPYPMMRADSSRARILAQIAFCRRLMGDSGFVILRGPEDPERYDSTIPGFDGPEIHEYAKSMWVSLYAPNTASDGDAPAVQ